MMYTGTQQRLQQRALADYLLVEQACAGDLSAYETLVYRYQDALYRFVRVHLGSEQAQDVVQFVLLQLYLCLAKLRKQPALEREERSIKPWLFRVAWNRCIDEQRKLKRGLKFFSELEYIDEEDSISSVLYSLLDPSPSPEELAENHDDQERLRAAIQVLPVKLRDVIWLRYAEDLTFIEIGRRLNIPASTAKTYFYRARLKLRAVLSSRLERATA